MLLNHLKLEGEKAVEGHRSPRRCARNDDSRNTRSVVGVRQPSGALGRETEEFKTVVSIRNMTLTGLSLNLVQDGVSCPKWYRVF